MFHVGGSWNWSDKYFTDVNADGLPDFVDGNTIHYNHLDCSSTPCTPRFDESDTDTRVPLNVRALQHDTDTTEAKTLALLKSLSPPVDNVRRWRAPFKGTVRVSFDAVVPPTPAAGSDCSAPHGIRLAVQQGPKRSPTCMLTPGQHWKSGGRLESVDVAKGQFLFFRVGADLDCREPRSPGTRRSPTQRSTAWPIRPSPAGSSTPTVWTRRGTTRHPTSRWRVGQSWVSAPSTGLLMFTGVLDKQRTTDYVRPTMEHATSADHASDVPLDD